ncbi:MAG: SDR family oxidoreductase [Burkholderiaceae bacterium]|nr:SDR family oxidoreductase [Burkholderiaceae bacterium]
MTTLQGKSILVTGGGSGIGEGCARHFAACGARVTISGRRPERIRAVAESIGPDCSWIAGDVTKAEDRQAMLEQAISHGGGRLDCLVNNAGITHHSGLMNVTPQALHDVLEANLVAPTLFTQAAVPALEASQGCVIFIGSVHTRLALPGRLAYAASKGGIQTLSRVLAAELGPCKIRVNCVIPGAVATEINAAAANQTPEEAKAFFQGLAHLHPIGRIGEAVDIARAMEYLINADWTTGAVLDVDGGMGLGVTRL